MIIIPPLDGDVDILDCKHFGAKQLCPKPYCWSYNSVNVHSVGQSTIVWQSPKETMVFSYLLLVCSRDSQNRPIMLANETKYQIIPNPMKNHIKSQKSPCSLIFSTGNSYGWRGLFLKRPRLCVRRSFRPWTGTWWGSLPAIPSWRLTNGGFDVGNGDWYHIWYIMVMIMGVTIYW